MKELYTKPMSHIDEFKTVDVITTSRFEGSDNVDVPEE